MRIFFKPPTALQAFVNERVEQLRVSSNEEISKFTEGRTEEITLASHPATIYTVSETMPDGRMRVVVQAFTKARLFGSHVAVEGFYRLADGAMVELTKEDYWEFG